MKKTSLIVLLLVVLNISPAFSWGYKGHKIVAQIAKACLDKQVIDSVQYYLSEISFEDASVWMDEMRSDHAYDYMKPMHYVNIEKDKTYVPVTDPNIINQLNLVIAQLRNKNALTKEEIKKDLLLLFHLVGDIHQPLHTGYADDKGGNAVEVNFLGTPSNLHKVWDTNIIEEQNITVENCLEILHNFSPKEKKEIQKINVSTWTNESRAALSFAYSFTDKTIDKNYIPLAEIIVKKRLTESGIRLASVLNETFSVTKKPLSLTLKKQ